MQYFSEQIITVTQADIRPGILIVKWQQSAFRVIEQTTQIYIYIYIWSYGVDQYKQTLSWAKWWMYGSSKRFPVISLQRSFWQTVLPAPATTTLGKNLSQIEIIRLWISHIYAMNPSKIANCVRLIRYEHHKFIG